LPEMKVIMFPNNHVYVTTLRDNLIKFGVKVALMPSFHYATPYNFLKIGILRLKGYKIIHVHWLFFFSSAILFLFTIYCKLLGIRIVWEIHNVLPHKKFFHNDLKISRYFFNVADLKFVHYISNKKELKEKLNVDTSDVYVIPHASFIENYPNTITKESARTKLGLNLHSKVILVFGFIQEYRGYRTLIESIEKHHLQDIEVVVTGELRDKKLYDFLVEKENSLKNLHVFEGYVDDTDIQIFMNAADVVVLPYDDITTSGVVLLAYAFKRPVITTRVGGMADVVIEGTTGLLIPPKDPLELKNAIMNMFKIDFVKMGENGYAMSSENYSWESVAKKVCNLYSKIS